VTSPRPIEIIGGGLAGLALGLALRRAEVPVTLFEAGRYPRHRVCGDFIAGLSAATVARLQLAPLLADARSHREVAWFHRARLIRVQRLPAPAVGLSRHALDARLAAAFVAAGGDLRSETRVTDPAPRPGRVLASGRVRRESSWLGLKLHLHGLALSRDLELHLGSEGYVGLATTESGAVNVCGLFRRRAVGATGPALLPAYLGAVGLTALAARIAAARPDPSSCCAVAALDYAAPAPEPGAIRLGDAYGLIPPFTGNGMAVALQSAETALDPLLAYARGSADWAATCAATNRALQRRFRVRLLTARLLHPFLLHPRRQRLLALLTQTRLVPLRPLYALLH
jgi:menaquinone-9 beta-reductase